MDVVEEGCFAELVEVRNRDKVLRDGERYWLRTARSVAETRKREIAKLSRGSEVSFEAQSAHTVIAVQLDLLNNRIETDWT